MSERIRSLLERVGNAEDPRDRHDAELRQRLPARASVAALEREIASEIAYSLGKAAHLLETALRRALDTRKELEAAELSSEARLRRVARFNEERKLAERRLRDLLIQREAIGFRRHSDLHERYVIPPALPDPAATMSERIVSEPIVSEPIVSEPIASEPIASERNAAGRNAAVDSPIVEDSCAATNRTKPR